MPHAAMAIRAVILGATRYSMLNITPPFKQDVRRATAV
jgi:hypothetical protein